MCEAYTQSELKFGKKGALGEKTRTLDPQRIQNTRELGLRTKVHRWCETQVLIGWNFLVSHHESITLCSYHATKARFASLARFWHTRARRCINRVTKVAWACAACCLDIVWNPGLINSRALCTAESSVMTISLLISDWNRCSHSGYQFDERKQDWQVQKFEVRWPHKAWRQFSSALRLFAQKSS